MATALTADGYRVRIIVPGDDVDAQSEDRFAVDLHSPEALKRVHSLIVGAEGERVGCLVNLLPLVAPARGEPGTDPLLMDPYQQTNALFLLVREFHEDLATSAEEGGSLLLNVTGLDGHFGLCVCDDAGVAVAGTLGLTKAFKREFPRVVVRTIDVDRSSPRLCQQLLEELERPLGPLETGLSASGRTTLELIAKPLSASLPPLPIDAASVVLVTGGGQGITAEIVRALAASQCLVVVVGRAAIPSEESAEISDLDDAALRQSIVIGLQQSGEPFTAHDIEQAFSQIRKAHELRRNLDSFRQAGARVEYHSLDVRDIHGLGRLIDNLYERHGRIDGVIHGAGVIHDKLIKDKTAEIFADVFRTKVDSALCLASRLRPVGLKFLVLFSSISGRFGNRGQSDYAAANETLNKLARRLSREWSGTRVVAINWGPWNGGMVSEALRLIYAARGMGLIPIDEGVQACLAELSAADGEPEIVLACNLDAIVGSHFGG